MTEWQFAFSGPILCGAVIHRVGEELVKLGGKCPLIVTGARIAESGIVEQVLESCKAAGLESVVYQVDQINPTDEDVYNGMRVYQSACCDAVIALGGGSRIDAAKAIRLMVSHSDKLEKYYFDIGGIVPLLSGMPPLVCIPTTAGSGSEVSRGAVITDTKEKRKRLIAGPGMMSTLAILDPGLSVSLSPQLTAETGLDALSHALETFVGTNYNPFAEGLARQAAKLIYTYLPQAVNDGGNLEARRQMLIGSAMGALGFSKGLGVVHSLAHQLLHIPHGLAISILLPYGMEFNIDVVADGYVDLALVMGVVEEDVFNRKEMAKRAIEAVRSYSKRFDLPERLSDVGVVRKDLTRMATGAMLDHCHHTNPRPCTEEDMLVLLERAF